MADTIITNTPRSSDDSGGAGWVVALVIILAITIGGLVLYQKGFFNGNEESTTNINVSIPDIPDTVTPPPATTN
jgi:hypothetical protein